MGNTVSAQAAQEPPPGCPMHTGGAAATPAPAPAPASSGKCPVDHGAATGKPAGHPVGGDISACPMHSDNQKPGSKDGKVYNVYMQEVDPTNNMPKNPNQLPAPGQTKELSTKRQVSSIPKGGTDGTWTYPSEQMFFNALSRKGKADGVTEDDMSVVIAIHNNMNETTWKRLLEWENRHLDEHDEGGPRLRRFTGKPHDLSLKAKVKSFFGFGYPFDRHDWFVTRGDKEVRYIIDYYYDNARNDAPSPEAAADGMTGPIHVDVRPALDSPQAVLDRLAMFPSRAMAALRRGYFYSDGLNPNARPKAVDKALNGGSAQAGASAPAESAPSGPAAEAAATLATIDERCAPHLAALQMAATEDIRRNASVALNYCMARVVCPDEGAAFMAVLESEAEEEVGKAGGAEEEAFLAMTQCTTTKVAALYEAAAGAGEGASETGTSEERA